MKVKNAAGKIIETELDDRAFKPYKGGGKNEGKTKVVKNLEDALKRSGLKNGMTFSFHHQLRNGDFVLNKTLEEINNLGVKDIRLAQTAMFNAHEPVIDFIREGVVTRIEGSINGVVGDFISKNNPLKAPVILRSHGGRWSAVRHGELHPNIAIIAASSADIRGNATGLLGKSAFGNIAYSQVDAWNADKVIIVTDNLTDYPCPYREIYEGLVDYVIAVSYTHLTLPTN